MEDFLYDDGCPSSSALLDMATNVAVDKGQPWLAEALLPKLLEAWAVVVAEEESEGASEPSLSREEAFAYFGLVYTKHMLKKAKPSEEEILECSDGIIPDTLCQSGVKYPRRLVRIVAIVEAQRTRACNLAARILYEKGAL